MKEQERILGLHDLEILIFLMDFSGLGPNGLADLGSSLHQGTVWMGNWGFSEWVDRDSDGEEGGLGGQDDGFG